jgi:ABC-2 type transport system ATP-binding protein
MRIEARDLSLAYGDVVALRSLTADVEGHVIGVLGATASGKTSLLQVMAGVVASTAGEVRIDGHAVAAGKRRDVAFVPQDAGAFPYFQRPKQTMTLALGLRGVESSEYPAQFLEALGLGDDDRGAAGYSTGMRQKARIAYAMVHTPRLLLLDEPMAGLDVRERYRVLRLLDRLRRLTAIVFSTHHPEEAAAVCDKVLVLSHGAVAACGTPSELTERAAGHVFETSMPLQHLPAAPDWDVVSAERTGDALQLRVVGSPPPDARPVPPRLIDAYVFLTAKAERGRLH